MKTLEALKDEMLSDAETHAAYDALTNEYTVARELIAARTRAGMSQDDVAQRMGTTQSVVARLESGKRPPSLRTMQRYAHAVNGQLVLHIR